MVSVIKILLLVTYISSQSEGSFIEWLHVESHQDWDSPYSAITLGYFKNDCITVTLVINDCS